MSKTRTFKSNTGYGFTIWAHQPSGHGLEVRVPADETVESDDPAVIDALEQSPHTDEVKAASKK